MKCRTMKVVGEFQQFEEEIFGFCDSLIQNIHITKQAERMPDERTWFMQISINVELNWNSILFSTSPSHNIETEFERQFLIALGKCPIVIEK